MRTILRLAGIALIAVLSGVAAAQAQSAVTEEAIAPNGAVMQQPAFTAEQRHAIYTAAVRQKTRSPTDRMPVSVGAAVPVSVELRDLPDQANDGVLKYALVDSDVVVVDPLAMRVVDVIHGGARP